MPTGSGFRDILTRVREAAAKRICFLPHAVNQMNSPERMISTEEIRAVVFYGVLVENYPEDVRGHSCLMLGWGEGDRPLTLCVRQRPTTWRSSLHIGPVRHFGNLTGGLEGRGKHGMFLLQRHVGAAEG
jgi:hypothetical protein